MIRLATVLACAAMLGLASAPGASAVTRPVKVITHNIAGGYVFAGRLTAVDAAVRQARIWSPDVVMLQEVCEAQARVLRDRLPAGYHYVFTVMRRNNPDCGDHGPHFGNVLASKWPLSGVTRTNLRGDGHRKKTEDVRYFKLTCASVAVSGVPAGRLRACVTQLRAGHGGRPWLDAARTEQVRRIHKALHDDITYRHVRVVVAGDFNARPQNPALDEMYRLKTGGGLGGAGDFYEGDQTDHRYFFHASDCGPLGPCRSGEDTCCDELPRDPNDPDPLLDRKYDYVFFSAPEVSQLSGQALALEPGRGGSDHVLYRASALFEF